MVGNKVFFLLAVLIALVAGAKNFYGDEDQVQQSRHLDDENQRWAVRNFAELDDEEEEQEFESRQAGTDNYVISLKNDAPMIVRLHVLYVNAAGAPVKVTTDQIIAGQNKSITLPPSAKSIKYAVQVDLFANHWRTASKGALTEKNTCFRISGVTLFPKVQKC